jgi:hypothetical protein
MSDWRESEIERLSSAVTNELLRQGISPAFGTNLRGINPPLDIAGIVRALLKALREPRMTMMSVACDDPVVNNGAASIIIRGRAFWRAAIDTLLDEHP